MRSLIRTESVPDHQCRLYRFIPLVFLFPNTCVKYCHAEAQWRHMEAYGCIRMRGGCKRLHVRICICDYMRLYAWILHMCIYIGICICICMCIFTSHIYIYACYMYHIYIHKYIHIHICIYISYHLFLTDSMLLIL